MKLRSIQMITLYLLLSITMSGQGIIGSWQSHSTDENGVEIENMVIFSEGYQVSTNYHKSTGKFVDTNGGSWKLEGNTMAELVEFHSTKPDAVGTTKVFPIELQKDTLRIVGKDQYWVRVDDGTPGALRGAWLMSGRVRNNETTYRNTDRPRKTMKILSGTRFQWVAYNTETKEFKGTGGGTYTTIDGKYQENIKFFSRDNAKVGMSLEFDFAIENNDWQHKGFSSKGDPMHEIWSMRK